MGMPSEIKKSRTFKIFNYRGKSLEQLLEMKLSEFAQLITSKNRRHLLRGINKYENRLLEQVSEWHQKHEKTKVKPGPIKTHERTMIIVPSMIGCSIADHCGNGFFPLEIKPQMIGKKLKAYGQQRCIQATGDQGWGRYR